MGGFSSFVVFFMLPESIWRPGLPCAGPGRFQRIAEGSVSLAAQPQLKLHAGYL